MFERIKTYLLYGTKYGGIEHTSTEDEPAIFITVVTKKNKELNLVLTTQEELITSVSNQLPKNQHVSLAINNNRVLTKFVQKSFTESVHLINEAFPNINISEFYYEILPQGANTIVSICRKAYVNSIIEEYTKQGINIIDFSLGALSVSNVLPYLNNSKLAIYDQLFIIDNNKISTVESHNNIANSRSYSINGVEIYGDYILSFSSALSCVLDNKSTYSNFENKVRNIKNEFFQNVFFAIFIKFGLSFVLLLLLINFFGFNYYYNKTSELNQMVQMNLETKQKLVDLNTLVEKKERTVKNLLNSGNSKTSFYLSEVVSLLPEAILLNTFNYQPVLKRLKNNEPIKSDINSILLKGLTVKGDDLSNFIKRIESLDWVEKVEILAYGYETKNSSDFSLKIQIKNE